MINMKDTLILKVEVPWEHTDINWLVGEDGFLPKVDEKNRVIYMEYVYKEWRLFNFLNAACNAVGAKLVERKYKGEKAPGKAVIFFQCKRCRESSFDAERITAKYCKKCRAFRESYKGRKETDPDYKESRKEYMREYMKVRRKLEKKRGRKKRRAS
jgi:hypothetical protein